MIKAETIRHEQYTQVRLFHEKLDAAISGDLKALMVLEFQDGRKNLILDMESVRFCDPGGLDAILLANRLATEQNGTFVLCRLNDQVAGYLHASQLDTVLNVVPSPEEAVDLVLFNEIENQLRAESGED